MTRVLNIVVGVILLALATFIGVPVLGYSMTYWELVFYDGTD
jgi:hypothetical protein